MAMVGPRKSPVHAGYSYECIAPASLASGHRILLGLGHCLDSPAALGALPVSTRRLYLWKDGERRPLLGRGNDAQHGVWHFRDVHGLAARLGCAPVLLQRTAETDGAQSAGSLAIPPPATDLSNRHLQYVLTWFGVAAGTLAMSLLRR
jgi:surfeit locus 1 family protein